MHQLQTQAEQRGFPIDSPCKAYSATKASHLKDIFKDLITGFPDLQLILILVQSKISIGLIIPNIIL